MRLRVVCGLRVTMASFSPTSAFSSVDFPALGRPMMETNPERNAMSGLDLLGLEADAHAVHTALGGFEHLESQSVLVENLTGLGNVSGKFAHQAGNRGRLFLIGPDAEQLLQEIDVGIAVKNVGGVALLYDLGLLVLVADFSHDLFDQIFDRDQATDSAIFVYHDRHADVVALHLAEQFASQLGFGDEVHVGLHQVANCFPMCLDIGNLQQVLGIHNALDVIDISFAHRYARIGMFLHQFGKFGDCHGGWHSDDLRSWRHDFADGFVAELDYRLDQVSIALLQNAFLLTSLNQCVNGFRWMLRLFAWVLLRKRRNGKCKAKNQRGRQRKINQHPQHRHPMPQPLAPGADEKHIGQQPIENHDYEDDADCRLHQVEHDPALLHEQHIPDEHTDARHADLRQHCHGKRGPLAAGVKPRLNIVLVSIDVFLKLARQELAHLGMQAVNVRDQRQNRKQDQQQDE